MNNRFIPVMCKIIAANREAKDAQLFGLFCDNYVNQNKSVSGVIKSLFSVNQPKDVELISEFGSVGQAEQKSSQAAIHFCKQLNDQLSTMNITTFPTLVEFLSAYLSLFPKYKHFFSDEIIKKLTITPYFSLKQEQLELLYKNTHELKLENDEEKAAQEAKLAIYPFLKLGQRENDFSEYLRNLNDYLNFQLEGIQEEDEFDYLIQKIKDEPEKSCEALRTIYPFLDTDQKELLGTMLSRAIDAGVFTTGICANLLLFKESESSQEDNERNTADPIIDLTIAGKDTLGFCGLLMNEWNRLTKSEKEILIDKMANTIGKLLVSETADFDARFAEEGIITNLLYLFVFLLPKVELDLQRKTFNILCDNLEKIINSDNHDSEITKEIFEAMLPYYSSIMESNKAETSELKQDESKEVNDSVFCSYIKTKIGMPEAVSRYTQYKPTLQEGLYLLFKYNKLADAEKDVGIRFYLNTFDCDVPNDTIKWRAAIQCLSRIFSEDKPLLNKYSDELISELQNPPRNENRYFCLLQLMGTIYPLLNVENQKQVMNGFQGLMMNFDNHRATLRLGLLMMIEKLYPYLDKNDRFSYIDLLLKNINSTPLDMGLHVRESLMRLLKNEDVSRYLTHRLIQLYEDIPQNILENQALFSVYLIMLNYPVMNNEAQDVIDGLLLKDFVQEKAAREKAMHSLIVEAIDECVRLHPETFEKSFWFILDAILKMYTHSKSEAYPLLNIAHQNMMKYLNSAQKDYLIYGLLNSYLEKISNNSNVSDKFKNALVVEIIQCSNQRIAEDSVSTKVMAATEMPEPLAEIVTSYLIEHNNKM